MSDTYDLWNSQRDQIDAMHKLNVARTGVEVEKTRLLLEEQVRLQRESLELEKKKLAQEQEKIELERRSRGQPTYTQRRYPQTTSGVSGTHRMTRHEVECAILDILTGKTGAAGMQTRANNKVIYGKPHPDDEKIKVEVSELLSQFLSNDDLGVTDRLWAERRARDFA